MTQADLEATTGGHAPAGRVAAGLDPSSTAFHLALYRAMVVTRAFEEATGRLFLRGDVYGSTHLCIGHEAVGPGVCSVLGADDWVSATYRGHGNVLAAGMDPQQFMDELLGRATGICGGRAGSMNAIDIGNRIIGCFGIVGGALGAATGLALALKRSGNVAVGFLGDGAVNQAYFHECLNFAKVQQLPVVFVCENNGYGEYTRMEDVTPGGILARPRAMEIASEQADGQDVWAVRAAAQRAVDIARRGEGPAFVELLTYRFSDHGRGDPVSYRPDGEMERWRQRDPLLVARRRLVDELGVDAARIDEVDADVAATVLEIEERALQAPFPDPAAPAREFAP
jgi:TPP-dependent pyruvate/acetoin dehydrogenase alpha subunit